MFKIEKDGDSFECMDAYRYGYDIGHAGNFHHENHGPDGVTYGCYGLIGADNLLHATHYVADINGYRTIEPNENVEVFPEITLDDSAEEKSKLVKGKVLEWKDLHLPKGCGMFKGGVLPDIPIIKLPNGIFVNVGHEIEFLNSTEHAPTIAPIKGLIKDSEEITKNNIDEITEKVVDNVSFVSKNKLTDLKNKVNEKNSVTYQIKSEPEPDINIEHPIEKNENNLLNKNKYEKADVDGKFGTKNVINKFKSKITNDEKNADIFESPLDDYNKNEHKSFDSGNGFQISKTLTESKPDSEFGKNIYLKRDDKETEQQKENIHQISSKNNKFSHAIDDFNKRHHFQNNKPISNGEEIVYIGGRQQNKQINERTTVQPEIFFEHSEIGKPKLPGKVNLEPNRSPGRGKETSGITDEFQTSFGKVDVQAENIEGLFGGDETTTITNKNFESNNKSFDSNKQNFNLNQGRPKQNNKFKNFVENKLNKTFGTLTGFSGVAQTSFVGQRENNNRSDTNGTFVNENTLPSGFRKSFGNKQNFNGNTSISYVKKQNSKINKGQLGTNNQTLSIPTHGNFRRPSGAAHILGGVRKSFIAQNKGGNSMISSHGNLENTPNYVGNTLTMQSSYGSQGSLQINQGQLGINNQTTSFALNGGYANSGRPIGRPPASGGVQASFVAQNGGGNSMISSHGNLENTPNYVGNTLTMQSSYGSQGSLQINQGQLGINNQTTSFALNGGYANSGRPIGRPPASGGVQASFVAQNGGGNSMISSHGNLENTPNYVGNTLTMQSSYGSQGNLQINQGQLGMNNQTPSIALNGGYGNSGRPIGKPTVSGGVQASLVAQNGGGNSTISSHGNLQNTQNYGSQGYLQINQSQLGMYNQTPSFALNGGYGNSGRPIGRPTASGGFQASFVAQNGGGSSMISSHGNLENTPNYVGNTLTMPSSYGSQGNLQINQGQLGMNNQTPSFTLNGGYGNSGRPIGRPTVSGGVQASLVAQNGGGNSTIISHGHLQNTQNYVGNTLTMPSSYGSQGNLQINQGQVGMNNQTSSFALNGGFGNSGRPIGRPTVSGGVQASLVAQNGGGNSMTISHGSLQNTQNYGSQGYLQINQGQLEMNNQTPSFTLNGGYGNSGKPIGRPTASGGFQASFVAQNGGGSSMISSHGNLENTPNYFGNTLTMPSSYGSQGNLQINQGQLGVNNQTPSFALNGGYGNSGRPIGRPTASGGIQASFVAQNGGGNSIISSQGNLENTPNYVENTMTVPTSYGSQGNLQINQGQLGINSQSPSFTLNGGYGNSGRPIGRPTVSGGVQASLVAQNGGGNSMISSHGNLQNTQNYGSQGYLQINQGQLGMNNQTPSFTLNGGYGNSGRPIGRPTASGGVQASFVAQNGGGNSMISSQGNLENTPNYVENTMTFPTSYGSQGNLQINQGQLGINSQSPSFTLNGGYGNSGRPIGRPTVSGGVQASLVAQNGGGNSMISSHGNLQNTQNYGSQGYLQINQGQLGMNNQTPSFTLNGGYGNSGRPIGRPTASGGVQASFVAQNGGGSSMISSHGNLENTPNYVGNTLTMPSSYGSQGNLQINQGQLGINSQSPSFTLNGGYGNSGRPIGKPTVSGGVQASLVAQNGGGNSTISSHGNLQNTHNYGSQGYLQINQSQLGMNNQTPSFALNGGYGNSGRPIGRPTVSGGVQASLVAQNGGGNSMISSHGNLQNTQNYGSQGYLQINQGQLGMNNQTPSFTLNGGYGNSGRPIGRPTASGGVQASFVAQNGGGNSMISSQGNLENTPNYVENTMTVPTSYGSQGNLQINQGQLGINSQSPSFTLNGGYGNSGRPIGRPTVSGGVQASLVAQNGGGNSMISSHGNLQNTQNYGSQGYLQINQGQLGMNNQTPSFTLNGGYGNSGRPIGRPTASGGVQASFVAQNGGGNSMISSQGNLENTPNYVENTMTVPTSYGSQGNLQINQGQLGVNNQTPTFTLNGGYGNSGRPIGRPAVSSGTQTSFVGQNGSRGQSGILGGSMLLNQNQFKTNKHFPSPKRNERFKNKINPASITEHNSSSAKSTFVGTSMTLSVLNHDLQRDLQDKSHFMRNSTKIPALHRAKEVLNISQVYTDSNNENQISTLNGVYENYTIQSVTLRAPIINRMSLEIKNQTSSHLKKIGNLSAISSSTGNPGQGLSSSRNITGLDMLMQVQEIISDVSNISKAYYPPNNTAIPIKVPEMSRGKFRPKLENIKNESSGKYFSNSFDKKVVKENLPQKFEDFEKTSLQELDEIRGEKHISSNIRNGVVSDVSYEKAKDLEKEKIHNEDSGIKLKDSTVQNEKPFSKIKYKDNEQKIFSTLSDLSSPGKINQNIFMNNFEFDKSKIISAGFEDNSDGLQVQQIEKNNEKHSLHPISRIKFNQNDITSSTVFRKDHPNESIKQEVDIDSFKDHINIKNISPETFKIVQKLDKVTSTNIKPSQENIYQDPRISNRLTDQYLPTLNDIKNLQKFNNLNEIQLSAKFDSSNTASGVIPPNFVYHKKQQALILDKNNNGFLCLDNISLPAKIPVFPPKMGYQEYYSVNNIPDGAVIGLLPVISFENYSEAKEKENEHLKKIMEENFDSLPAISIEE